MGGVGVLMGGAFANRRREVVYARTSRLLTA